MHRKANSENLTLKNRFSQNSASHQEDDVTAKPLVLYICRVPGNLDVFLTPSKPPGSTISAVDVLTSVYYVHVDSNQTFNGSEAVSLKLLRRVKGQEPYDLVAELSIPVHKRYEDPVSRGKAFAQVSMFSCSSGTPSQDFAQFEILRQSVDIEQKPGDEIIDYEEWHQSSQDHQAEKSASLDEQDPAPVPRHPGKRKRILRKFANKQEAGAALSFTTHFGTRCIMKSSTAGDNLKTYEENVGANGGASRLLTAELRFNLAPESANKSKFPSKTRAPVFALHKRNSMGFLSENRAPAGVSLSDPNAPSNHHFYASESASFQRRVQGRTNTFLEQRKGFQNATSQGVNSADRRRHPNRAPLPPPNTFTTLDWNSDSCLGPKPSISRKPVPPPRNIAQENIRPQFGWDHAEVERKNEFHNKPLNLPGLDAESIENEPPPLPVRRHTTNNDPLALGRQQLGGGMDGQQAKLGKILVYSPGLRMTDAIVAANIAIWYQGFLQSSFSTTIDL